MFPHMSEVIFEVCNTVDLEICLGIDKDQAMQSGLFVSFVGVKSAEENKTMVP